MTPSYTICLQDCPDVSRENANKTSKAKNKIIKSQRWENPSPWKFSPNSFEKYCLLNHET